MIAANKSEYIFPKTKNKKQPFQAATDAINYQLSGLYVQIVLLWPTILDNRTASTSGPLKKVKYWKLQNVIFSADSKKIMHSKYWEIKINSRTERTETWSLQEWVHFQSLWKWCRKFPLLPLWDVTSQVGNGT